MADSECQSKTPKPVNIKFNVGDYARDITQHAEIQNNRPSSLMGEMSLTHGFQIFGTPNFATIPRQNCITGFTRFN